MNNAKPSEKYEKPSGNKKVKKANAEKNELIRSIFSFLLLFFAVFSASPQRGFISSLPLLFAAGFIVSFVYDEPVKNSVVVALSAAAISVADYADLKYAAVYTVSCVAFYLLTAFCAKLLKKAISGKSKSGWLSLLNCALLSVLLIAAHFFMLGTPWENISAADSVRQYAEEKYTNQKFASYRAGYDVRSGLYNVNVYYDFKGTTISSPIAVRENSFDDGYFLDTAFSVSSYRSSELISFLKTKFVDDQFTVTCAPFLKSSRDYQYFTALPDDSENKLYLSDMAFNLTFDFELPTASEFYDACRKYYDYLKENNYEFGQITFFGGDKGTMYYYIAATPEAFPDDSSAVIPFTADAYKVFDRAR